MKNQSLNEETQKKKEDKKIVDNSDKYPNEFDNLKTNDPKQEGENLFLPYDEKIDEKCYNVNKINDWAKLFYNLKTGILLEKYKQLLSKSEYSQFFEAMNYEYGINNHKLDLQKAFDIYKKAADSSNDILSMYRLYHIYKKDFKKFNLEKRSHVLETFYIMKSFAYSPPLEKREKIFQRFYIWKEIATLLIDENNTLYS